MYNLVLLSKVRQQLESKIPFLSMLCEQVKEKKPYHGLRVIHTVPITLCTVTKIEALLLGGADVVVSSTKTVKPQPEAVKMLKDARINVNFNTPTTGTFDLHLDCCAELIDNKPTIGAAELTQTGSHRYSSGEVNYPVISIDNCSLKNLETIGTGYSFVKAFSYLTGQDLLNKKVIVFGYGKVGKGIVHAVKKQTKDIIIIENSPFIVETLKQKELNAIAIQDIKRIKKELRTAFCIVTSTGKKGFISKAFSRNDFHNAFLANMGALDEYGDLFENKDVLFGKRPINFSLPIPTKLEFLDPILYAHNIAIDLLIKGFVKKGVHPFPKDLSEKIINQWQSIYSSTDSLSVDNELLYDTFPLPGIL